MKTNQLISRRRFLRQSTRAAVAATAFPTVVSSSVFGAGDTPAPSNRIGVGCIGVGEQGCGVMGNFLSHPEARVLAICDVNARNLEIARQMVNKRYGNQDCATYRDFREMLARPDIDVVQVATPDHWHVLAALAAVRAGKDVYVEKPLGLSLREDQTLREEVRKRDRRFQFGTQQRSDYRFRAACQLVRNGRIGRLTEVRAWAPGSVPGGSTRQVPPPPELDYNFWVGPAPFKPHTENLCARQMPRKTWWFVSDYALGWVAGWGIHPVDIGLWGAGDLFAGKVAVEGEATIPTEGICNTATTWDVRYQFESGVRMHFIGTQDSVKKPVGAEELADWKKRYGRTEDHGTAFEGTDGWVFVSRNSLVSHPQSLLDERVDDLKIQLRRSGNHVGNLLECFKTRAQTICPIEEAVQADLLCHLADQATRLKRKLTWDSRTERFVDDDEAQERLASRPMRTPWRLEG